MLKSPVGSLVELWESERGKTEGKDKAQSESGVFFSVFYAHKWSYIFIKYVCLYDLNC